MKFEANKGVWAGTTLFTETFTLTRFAPVIHTGLFTKYFLLQDLR